MPSRDFQNDLAQACLPGTFSRLTDVRGGSEDGSFSFTYTTPSKAHTIDVEVTVSETSEYPRRHDYFAFITTENAPEVVPIILASSQDAGAFRSLTVPRFLKAISECLDDATFAEEAQFDSPQQETGSGEDFDDMDWDASSEIAINPAESVSKLRDSIRDDLRKARNAGFRVGYLGDLDGCVILSASRRISKLRISHEAMEAWGVRPSEFLVLLIRYRFGYRPLADIIRNGNSAATNSTQLYAGVCDSYKPSFNSAQQVFLSGDAPGPAVPNASSNMEHMEPVLKTIFIGKSLQSLLNDRFMDIVKYRLEYGFSWTGAELYLNDGQGKLLDAEELKNPEYFKPDTWRASAPSFLSHDHLANTKSPSEMSLLLVAMQFTLRRFVKCTEFCLNCYCKINTEFEALKPFVCTKGLCLYQYMSLGMGPSLEWEISSQPYVVDLLISFAYARANVNKLENFPTGFRLGVLNPQRGKSGQGQDGPNSQPSKGRLTVTTGRGPCLRVNGSSGIKEGDWISLMLPVKQQGDSEVHARVKDTSHWPNIFLSDLILDGNLVHKTHGFELPFERDALYTVYDTDFDSLSEMQKVETIKGLLNTLPKVSDMKAFIDKGHSGQLRALAEWRDRIQPAALYVLQWIVGSNRSVIIYDDDPQHQVSGMDAYLQFRFAQGAPDKEEQFVSSVSQTASRLKLEYPTFFAWHGSGLHNWHSIVREGLHYREIVNGRSCGNGIYMSSNFSTSFGYSGYYRGTPASPTSRIWPNSELKCTSAIALNEVVNAPSEFTSNAPHYVVQHLDWVQPRYLFIQCQTPITHLKRPNIQPLSRVCAQAPERVVHGPNATPLQIPISATNSHRSRKQSTTQSPWPLAKSALNKAKRKLSRADSDPAPAAPFRNTDDNDDTDSIATLPEDRLLLQSDNEDGVTFEEMPKDILEFQPGTLLESSVQLLGEPAYASSRATRSLQKELNVAQKAQNERPLHELGWYINSDLVKNLYQWIVELHSFEERLPLAQDLKKAGLSSVVMELRFPPDYPLSPPFVRVIRPRFLRYSEGGGGHVTAGGAMCMELLTNTGWLAASSIESVLVQVRMAITNEEPRPARLDPLRMGQDYSVGEAISEYKRVCHVHGWKIPRDIDRIQWSSNSTW
ncbi:putative ubiquitin conjugating enzyme [Aspergillus lucknowensis]|uniref:UBC core domain-containing protein n=1 Tax=Aspergillus lucknowensis TaxID=176173 RepID=A0ABR4LWL5_9EURO